MREEKYPILSWGEVEQQCQWTGLLVGNGASIAVWPQFGYTSLYKRACAPKSRAHLTEADQRLFAAFEHTTNFETVLEALSTSEMVCQALELDQEYHALHARHVSIQQALQRAIHAVHVRYAAITPATLAHIRNALLAYQCLFTTNYDLLLYWAIMSSPNDRIKDYFFSKDSGFFDRALAVTHAGDKTIVYLHGGLHLVAQAPRRTRKLKAQGSGLLDLFGVDLQPGETPLLITEGAARDKLASIYQSDYLQFAYGQLASYTGPLVIFGHMLGESDQHIADAIRNHQDRPIAISIYPAPITRMRRRVAAYVNQFPNTEQLFFFDATTHPLGDPNLLIQDKEATRP